MILSNLLTVGCFVGCEERPVWLGKFVESYLFSVGRIPFGIAERESRGSRAPGRARAESELVVDHVHNIGAQIWSSESTVSQIWILWAFYDLCSSTHVLIDLIVRLDTLHDW